MAVSLFGTNLRFVLNWSPVPAFVLLLGIIALPSNAQRIIPGQGSKGIFLPSNRLDSRGIQRAQELIAVGEFSQAIRFLDDVLARDEDSFVPNLSKGSQGSSGIDSAPATSKEVKSKNSPAAKRADGEYGGAGSSGGQAGDRATVVRNIKRPVDIKNAKDHTGLKEVARQMLRDLPPEGQRIYEATFGPVAKRLLTKAIESGDNQQLRKITQRYFYTPAGHEAALLFAQYETDKGRHLTAALIYEQLLESALASTRFEPQLSMLAAASWFAADSPPRAEAILEELGQQGYRDVQLSGDEIPVHASQNGMLDWFLQAVGRPTIEGIGSELQWLTSRGNPARNAKTDGGLPHLRVRWQVRLLGHHNLEAVHEELASVFERQDKSRLPAATPLAVGDYVITRSAHGLIAVDFKTGKRVWQAQPQRESLLEDLMDASNGQSENENEVEPAQAFARMIWEDYLYNATSSDGQRIYVIRDLTLPKFSRARAMPFIPQQSRQETNDDTNRLCAYDLPTQGKLMWEIDGAARSDELKGAFFLGAPVTVGQSLYCLAEIKSETAIYLVALDRQTGALQWRQQLANLETGIALDMRRRLQAAMPSYDGGVLVCPTGAGVVVGVDLAKQALAWAYSYQPAARPSLRSRMLTAQAMLTRKQWVHSAPVIAGGRVLLTPPESDELHCLDLVTGNLLWKHPRGDALFLSGVEEDRVLLVGNGRMSALRLEDGKPAWSSGGLEFPSGSSPTGSGFFSDGQYFLPLSNAEIIAVDVSDGEIVARTSSRFGQLLGNLICYRGAVISQTGRFLDCFEQVDVLRAKSERRRADDPTDFEALRTLGEIAYNEGRLEQALALLSEAYASSPDDLRTQEVLSEALVAALDEDFAYYQDQLPLLGELQQGSIAAQLTSYRLQSKGLLDLGQTTEAFEVCLKAYQSLATFDSELSIGRDHKVSAQCWLAAQIAATWEAASFEEKEKIVELFAPLLAETKQVADASLWQQFYDCFGSLALAQSLGLDLAAEYIEQGNLLDAQQLSLKLIECDDPLVSNAAVAYSSRILHDAEMERLAKPFDALLQGELANQECLPGRNGQECLAEWSRETSLPNWPYGRVKTSVEESSVTRSSQRNRNPHTGIELERTDRVLGNCKVSLVGISSTRNREIVIRDGLGREFFRAKLDKGTQAIMNAQANIYGVSRGNLLVLSLGRQIVAFDTLSPNGQALWRINTTSSLQYLNYRSNARQSKFGVKNSIRSQSDGNWIGVIGPVNADSCIFQIEQRLVCVDSLSGEIKWSRSGLPLGCDLYGDEQHVFAIPRGTKQALVFNSVDGRLLGETDAHLPVWQERLATVGQSIIRWRRRADRRWELSSIDSFSGKVEWNQDFEKNAQLDVEQSRFAAVVESTGHCVIVDITDGSRIVDQPIKQNVSMKEVHLLVGSDDFVVAVQEPAKVDSTRHVMGFNRRDFSTAFAGQIYRFERASGLAAWDRPAEVQGLPLMLTQPVDTPVIAFAGNVRRRDKHGSKNEIGIMLLEKSSGRLIFHDETLPQSANHFFLKSSETQPEEFVVEMLTRKVKLQFTGQPRAPEPPAMHEVQRNVKAGSKGLRKIGEILIRGG